MAEFTLKDAKRTSISGSSFTLLARFCSTGIQLLSVAILSRLLTPEEHGVIGILWVFVGFISVFKDFGLSAATIQSPNLTEQQQSNLFWVNFGISALTALTLCCCAPLIAFFYEDPSLTGPVLVAAIPIVLAGLSAQFDARLVKNHEFVKKAVLETSGALVILVSTVAFAWIGFSYWSILFGQIVGLIFNLLALIYCSGFVPRFYDRKVSVKKYLSFGFKMTGFEVVNFFGRNADNFLIGLYFGKNTLGIYTRGYTLATFPIKVIEQPVRAVAFPVLSRLNEYPDNFSKYCFQLAHWVGILSCPIFVLLYFQSKNIIRVALGPQWLEVEFILQLLAIGCFFHPLISIRSLVLLSQGQAGRFSFQGIVVCILFICSFLVGIPFGPLGMSFSYAIVNCLMFLPLTYWLSGNTHFSFKAFCQAIHAPLICSITAGFGAHICVSQQFISDLTFFASFWSIVKFCFWFFILYVFFIRIMSPSSLEIVVNSVKLFFNKNNKLSLFSFSSGS